MDDAEDEPRRLLRERGDTWEYTGPVYVRPVGRGVSIRDDSAPFQYLEDMPDGDYLLEMKITRLSGPRSIGAPK